MHNPNDFDITRREMMIGTATLAAAAAVPGLPGAKQAAPAALPPASAKVSFTVNGAPAVLDLDTRTTLLDALREHLKLTGTKKGCDHGQCGACTVIVNGRRINACLSLALQHDGDEITTIEGLGTPEKPHPVQAAFIAEQAAQCGYCINGMVMTATAFLERTKRPSDADIRNALSGNLCRCGTHARILRAVARAAQEMAR